MRWVRESFDVRAQTAKLEVLYDKVIEEFARRHAHESLTQPFRAKKTANQIEEHRTR
jgi:hypothetical protein